MPENYLNITIDEQSRLHIGLGEGANTYETKWINHIAEGEAGRLVKEIVPRITNGKSENLTELTKLTTSEQIAFIKAFIPQYIASLSAGYKSMAQKISPARQASQLLNAPPLPTISLKDLKTLPQETLLKLSEKLQTQAEQITAMQLAITKAQQAQLKASTQ